MTLLAAHFIGSYLASAQFIWQPDEKELLKMSKHNTLTFFPDDMSQKYPDLVR